MERVAAGNAAVVEPCEPDRAPGRTVPPGPVVCRDQTGSVLFGRCGGEPFGGFGVGHEQKLGRVAGCVLDDVGAARVGAALGGGAGYRGQAPPGVGGEPGQDHGGEQLVGRRSEDAGLGRAVEDDVDAGRASRPEGFLERGDGRGRLEVVLLPERLHTFTVLGESFTVPKSSVRPDGHPTGVRDAAGERRDLGAEERRAFWSWAAIEIFRHTGIRIEELQELSHHSIISYRLPSGDVVPLLQIAPSKTDQERLILISPELADVLSAVISRVRDSTVRVPLIPSYDLHEKTWNSPMPLLFQWSISLERRPVSGSMIRKALDETLRASGITDSSGQPLLFQPHDFRRMFITEAILNGLPPHIAGHRNINTTMGYAAIYPTDALEAHRAFIARRRDLRPAE